MAVVIETSSLADALTELEEPFTRPIAGGVGVMLARAMGLPVGRRWVRVGELPELLEDRIEGPAHILGAALTLGHLARHTSPSPVMRLLAAAAGGAANPGIRAVASLGGNVIDAGGASDLVAGLVALRAEVEVVGRGGARSLSVEDLWGDTDRGVEPDGGDGHPALRSGELLRAIRLPAADDLRWGWQRASIRGAMDRSCASVAATIGDGSRVCIAVTAIASRPVRLRGAEERVREMISSGIGILAAEVRASVEADLDGVAVRDEPRIPAIHRRRIVPVLVERALAQAVRASRGQVRR